MGGFISRVLCRRPKRKLCRSGPPSVGIIDRVHPLDPTLRHHGLRSSRVEGVGDWLLQAEEFINWNTSEDEVVRPVLFCYGDPGVGKTHIGYEPTFLWENGGD